MTRVFNIKVNGNMYEVEVEEVKTTASVPVKKEAPKMAAPQKTQEVKPEPVAQAVAPKAAEVKAQISVEGGSSISAPMPGTINEIRVKEGDTVSRGQILLILEAMKMENEIMAPVDGVVAGISVSKGASVNAGELMIVIK